MSKSLQRFGKYEILEKLGSGGMATAYRAELAAAEGVRKRLVLKVIHPHLAEKKSFVEMFVAEAKIVASLSHSNIAQVFDFGKHENQYYIAMEEVIGKPLSRVLKAAHEAGYTRMPVPLALQIAIGVLDGLAYAHTKKDEHGLPLQLVHRDVTPDNVLLSFQGEVKVVDFGIAKTTESTDQTEVGTVRGKYPYMSPEQAQGLRDFDARSDIWAVGVMLYELLSGRRPYEGEFRSVIREIAEPSPVPTLRSLVPAIDPSLETIVMAALEKPRDKRPATARDFSHALTSYLHQNHPHSTRQEIQFLLGLLFPMDVSKEGADITVPPNFAEQLHQATSGDSAKPGPPVATHPPIQVASTRSAPVADGEATVNSLSGADDDEATVAGLPETKKKAETLAEILAAVRPGGIRPPEIKPDEEGTLAGNPFPKEKRPKSGAVAIKRPNPSGPRSNPKPTMSSHEISLKKDMGQAPRRESTVVAFLSLGAGALLIIGFMMVRSARDSDKPQEPAAPSVWITSSPPGASFTVDGAPGGKTPFSANVPPGQHTVAIEMVGYSPWAKTFTVQAGENLTLTANLDFVGTVGDGGAMEYPDRPEPSWPVASDEAHSVRWPKRFHILSLAKMALPLDAYKPLKIELNPKTAYQISTEGSVSLGRGRSTSTLLFYTDPEGRGAGRMGLLGPAPKTIKGAKSIRIFAFDEDLSDNSGALTIVTRISQYIPEKNYTFDARKHVLVPKPEHQYRIDGMSASAQYLIFSRLDHPALNKNWEGKATQMLCLSHTEKAQPLSQVAHVLPLGGHVTLDKSAGLSCFFLDDVAEDNSGTVELDIVDGQKVDEEGVNPKLYLAPGKW